MRVNRFPLGAGDYEEVLLMKGARALPLHKLGNEKTAVMVVYTPPNGFTRLRVVRNHFLYNRGDNSILSGDTEEFCLIETGRNFLRMDSPGAVETSVKNVRNGETEFHPVYTGERKIFPRYPSK